MAGLCRKVMLSRAPYCQTRWLADPAVPDPKEVCQRVTDKRAASGSAAVQFPENYVTKFSPGNLSPKHVSTFCQASRSVSARSRFCF